MCIILLFTVGELSGFPVRVSLYDSRKVNSVVISSWDGPLAVSSDEGFRYVIAQGQAIYATLRDSAIWLSDEHRELGTFKRLTVQGIDSLSVVRLRPVAPQLEARNYEELIIITVDINRIRLINEIDKELYIAGVIEAESGQGHTAEFYKAKAIICRTYLYGNTNRHQAEGFHLCDEVHCQAYKGQRQNLNPILSAVRATQDIIITHPADSTPILAVYHSNCGGETESSQNVWQSAMPYLVSITDPYCTSSPNARWQRTISLNEWTSYLTRNDYNTNSNANLNFQTSRRAQNYRAGNITIPLRKIRTDWQLRSTFFSLSVEGENVVFRGRGYGHGVGLCQEGAMEMGRRGFNYEDIIKFYYKNVNLTKKESLN